MNDSSEPPVSKLIWGTASGCAPKGDIDRVLSLHRFTGETLHLQEPLPVAAALETIPVLVATAIAAWPEELAADNGGSAHWADALVEVHPSPEKDEVVKHSARRVAVCCLAEMCCESCTYVAIVVACPGFLQALPAVLRALLQQYRWKQSYPCLYCPADHNQWQLIAERMVNMV